MQVAKVSFKFPPNDTRTSQNLRKGLRHLPFVRPVCQLGICSSSRSRSLEWVLFLHEVSNAAAYKIFRNNTNGQWMHKPKDFERLFCMYAVLSHLAKNSDLPALTSFASSVEQEAGNISRLDVSIHSTLCHNFMSLLRIFFSFAQRAIHFLRCSERQTRQKTATRFNFIASCYSLLVLSLVIHGSLHEANGNESSSRRLP